MRRLLIITLMAATLWDIPLKADDSDNRYWPIDFYLPKTAVLTVYYHDFIDKHQIDSPNAFVLFCNLLQRSEMLKDRLGELGTDPLEFYRLINELKDLMHGAEATNNQLINMREPLLRLDLLLENVQLTITERLRDEFRREVISKIPPMVYVGERSILSLDAIAMIVQ